MNRKQFVQFAHLFSMLSASKPSAEQVTEWANKRWERLSASGFGDAKPHKNKKAIANHYNALTGASKAYFDKFWQAFAYKHGKQEAAMTWDKLGDLSAAEYEHIIHAAKAEAAGRAAKKADGITIIMAQGWLSKARYADYEPQVPAAKIQQDEELQRLRSDLAYFASLKSEFGDEEVERTRERIKELEQ